ncbi:Mbov_0395 family pilin-like conjugal transfer protein [Metamycoplasma alkalescens]|uniref:Uncharacterized protein n=1 Tax=Metamycoplasma alkalescens TaxID=45363 RepID=A0A318UBX1_9BACT|nr:hypothetical protein [Metamycoplasma alkalescens]PYF42582.1 hypothetical protein BCF88_10910 [Metamycoplasma alkalescens]SYV90185.1 Uncharacterised protein [Metamycoplasma alkalescens]
MLLSTLTPIKFNQQTQATSDAAASIKSIANGIFPQIQTIGLSVLGIIVFILAISCIFAAISAQFKLKSGDKEAASQAKKRMKNILIAFICGLVILALFGSAIGIIKSTVLK